MIGFGTLANVLCIVFGGVVGLFIGERLTEAMRETLIAMTGIGVAILGVGGVMSNMLTIQDKALMTGGTIMMIVSLTLGAIIGELANIEGRIILFGEWLKKKSGSSGDNAFVSSFVIASCTVCIGAMAVIGAIEDGFNGNPSILIAKGVIDAIIICIMAASGGRGCIFSAIPVGMLQFSITLLAFFVGDFLPKASLANLSYVGAILIMCVGLNLVRERQIRVANVMPALLIAIAFGYFV